MAAIANVEPRKTKNFITLRGDDAFMIVANCVDNDAIYIIMCTTNNDSITTSALGEYNRVGEVQSP
jgi:hypothetical protein